MDGMEQESIHSMCLFMNITFKDYHWYVRAYTIHLLILKFWHDVIDFWRRGNNGLENKTKILWFWCNLQGVFKYFSNNSHKHSSTFSLLGSCVSLMYHPTCTTYNVNHARRISFTQMNRDTQHTPPTVDALLQHLKRACFNVMFGETAGALSRTCFM